MLPRNTDDPQHTTDLTPAQAIPEPTLAAVALPLPRSAKQTATPPGGGTGIPPGGATLPTCGLAAAAEGAIFPPLAATPLQEASVPGYEILSELGRGGMGVVYQARQIKANRVVALKMVLSGAHAGPDELRRFQTEAQAVARLQHPHIVQVHEVGEHEGRPFFSLELCSCGSLEKKLAGTPLQAKEAAAVLEKLARAMAAAHAEQIIHRDLKPANVLLGADGTPKITDFGLAKKLDEESGQTKSGAVMGTPSYMAPEQAEGKKTVGLPADIYALGAILYECLTGRPPFRAPTVMDTLLQVLADEPVTPRQLNAQVPVDLETICLKCLSKEPQRRYASAEALAEDLRRFQVGEPIRARAVGRLERGWRWCRRNPALAGALSAAVVALLLGSGIATGFAVQANRNADQAILARQSAEAATDRAEAERKRAEQAKERAESGELLARRHEYNARINLAQRAWEGGQVQLVLGLLDSTKTKLWEKEDLRGFEWFHLDRLCRANLFQLENLHNVAFSPDGQRLATVRGQDSIRIWDLAARKEIRSLGSLGNPGGGAHLMFSGDGKRLVAHNVYVVKVWDVETGKEQLSWIPLGGSGYSSKVALSPDGQRLAWYFAGAVRLVDVSSGKTIHTCKVTPVLDAAPRQLLAWAVWDIGQMSAPPGPLSAGVLLSCRVLEVQNRNLSPPAKLDGSPEFTFSPDGKHLVCLVKNHFSATLTLWDAHNGRELLHVEKPELARTVTRWDMHARHPLAFSPDGQRLAVAGLDGTVWVWEAASGKELFALKGHERGVRAVAFSANGKGLASAGNDKRVIVWNATTGKQYLTLKCHTHDVYNLAFIGDGRRLASASSDGTIRTWDVTRHQEFLSFDTSAGGASWVERKPAQDSAFNGDGSTLAVVAEGRSSHGWMTPGGLRGLCRCNNPAVKVWDLDRGSWEGVSFDGKVLALSRDGQRLAVAGGSPSHGRALPPRVWDCKRRQWLFALPGHEGEVTQLRFSDDSRWLASGSKDGTIRLWDASTGTLAFVLRGHRNGASALSFSADGQRLTSVGDEVKVWDVRTGRELSSVAAAFVGYQCWLSPDGQLVAYRSNAELIVWDVQSRKVLHTLRGHNTQINSVTFSGDGNRIATASWDRKQDDDAWVVARSEDQTVKLWDAHTGQELLTLRGPPGTVAFSLDGKRLACVGGDEVRIWEGTSWTETEKRTRWTILSDSAGEQEFLWGERQRLNERVATHLKANRWADALADVTAAIERKLEQPWHWQVRGYLLARRGEWDRAAADFAKGVECNRDDMYAWAWHLHTRLQLGDHEGYRRACAEMLHHFGAFAADPSRMALIDLCLLAARAVDDYAAIVRLAEQEVARLSKQDVQLRWARSQVLEMLGAALYRAGRYSDALQRLNEGRQLHEKGETIEAWFFQGMAHQRLGQNKEARQWVEKAIAGCEADPLKGPDDWPTRLRRNLLRREAEELLAGKAQEAK